MQLPASAYSLAMLDDMLMIGESALILELSTQRVRQLTEAGLLRSMRTSYGVRIFLRSDVLELKARREAQKEGRAHVR